MNREKLLEIIANTNYEGYHFRIVQKYLQDGQECNFLQAYYEEDDIHTCAASTQYTRKWYISNFATEGEVIQTMLKCLLTSMEHRVREHFLYKGKRVLSPHFGVDFLLRYCEESQEYREK